MCWPKSSMTMVSSCWIIVSVWLCGCQPGCWSYVWLFEWTAWTAQEAFGRAFNLGIGWLGASCCNQVGIKTLSGAVSMHTALERYHDQVH